MFGKGIPKGGRVGFSISGLQEVAAGTAGWGLGHGRKEIGVKKYVVKLSEAERNHLQALINKGKSTAKRLLKARILLKIDAGTQGENWSDGQIIEALDTNKSMVTRVRQQFVEEGLEAVLSRKERAAPAITPIFDGEKEARLVALACSTPPEGRARWTLRLLEDKVVELGIVERASDNTIRRVLKKHASAPPQRAMGHPAGGERRFRSGDGRGARRLYAAARSGYAAGVPGRDLQATRF
jgi:hypothetical protein